MTRGFQPLDCTSVRAIETRIMEGSGMGSDPHWGNGWGASRIRMQAAGRIRQTIEVLRANRVPVAPPDADLLHYIDAAAHFLDKEEWQLSRTWQVASDVARAHIDMGFATTEELKVKIREGCLRNMDEYYGLVPGYSLYSGVMHARGRYVRAEHGDWFEPEFAGSVHGIVQRVSEPPGGGPMPNPMELAGVGLLAMLGKKP